MKLPSLACRGVSHLMHQGNATCLSAVRGYAPQPTLFCRVSNCSAFPATCLHSHQILDAGLKRSHLPPLSSASRRRPTLLWRRMNESPCVDPGHLEHTLSSCIRASEMIWTFNEWKFVLLTCSSTKCCVMQFVSGSNITVSVCVTVCVRITCLFSWLSAW